MVPGLNRAQMFSVTVAVTLREVVFSGLKAYKFTSPGLEVK